MAIDKSKHSRRFSAQYYRESTQGQSVESQLTTTKAAVTGLSLRPDLSFK